MAENKNLTALSAVVLIALLAVGAYFYFSGQEKILLEKSFSQKFGSIELKKDVLISDKRHTENYAIESGHAGEITVFLLAPKMLAADVSELGIKSNADVKALESDPLLQFSAKEAESLEIELTYSSLEQKCSMAFIFPKEFIDALDEEGLDEVKGAVMEYGENDFDCEKISEIEARLSERLYNVYKEPLQLQFQEGLVQQTVDVIAINQLKENVLGILREENPVLKSAQAAFRSIVFEFKPEENERKFLLDNFPLPEKIELFASKEFPEFGKAIVFANPFIPEGDVSQKSAFPKITVDGKINELIYFTVNGNEEPFTLSLHVNAMEGFGEKTIANVFDIAVFDLNNANEVSASLDFEALQFKARKTAGGIQIESMRLDPDKLRDPGEGYEGEGGFLGLDMLNPQDFDKVGFVGADANRTAYELKKKVIVSDRLLVYRERKFPQSDVSEGPIVGPIIYFMYEFEQIDGKILVVKKFFEKKKTTQKLKFGDKLEGKISLEFPFRGTKEIPLTLEIDHCRQKVSSLEGKTGAEKAEALAICHSEKALKAVDDFRELAEKRNEALNAFLKQHGFAESGKNILDSYDAKIDGDFSRIERDLAIFEAVSRQDKLGFSGECAEKSMFGAGYSFTLTQTRGVVDFSTASKNIDVSGIRAFYAAQCGANSMMAEAEKYMRKSLELKEKILAETGSFDARSLYAVKFFYENLVFIKRLEIGKLKEFAELEAINLFLAVKLVKGKGFFPPNNPLALEEQAKSESELTEINEIKLVNFHNLQAFSA